MPATLTNEEVRQKCEDIEKKYPFTPYQEEVVNSVIWMTNTLTTLAGFTMRGHSEEDIKRYEAKRKEVYSLIPKEKP